MREFKLICNIISTAIILAALYGFITWIAGDPNDYTNTPLVPIAQTLFFTSPVIFLTASYFFFKNYMKEKTNTTKKSNIA